MHQRHTHTQAIFGDFRQLPEVNLEESKLLCAQLFDWLLIGMLHLLKGIAESILSFASV